MTTKQPVNLQYTTIKDPLPDFIYQELEDYCLHANVYHSQPKELISKLAKKHGLSEEMIFLTAGIDEAIQMFARSFGATTHIFTPTYLVYADAELFGGQLTQIPSITDGKYTITTDTIHDATLIFLANPNNPSGITPKDKVIELIKNNKHAIVCVDEAYGEFAPELSVIDQVKYYENLVIFRSFSKDYGMAGNRIGYFIAHPDVVDKVKPQTQWANVSYLSIRAAISALNHEDYFKNMRKGIQERRKSFEKFLDENNLPHLPSRINAVLLKFSSEEEGTLFANFVKSHNFIFNQGNGNANIGLDKSFVRFSISTEDQMNMLKETIQEFNKHKRNH